MKIVSFITKNIVTIIIVILIIVIIFVLRRNWNVWFKPKKDNSKDLYDQEKEISDAVSSNRKAEIIVLAKAVYDDLQSVFWTPLGNLEKMMAIFKDENELKYFMIYYKTLAGKSFYEDLKEETFFTAPGKLTQSSILSQLKQHRYNI